MSHTESPGRSVTRQRIALLIKLLVSGGLLWLLLTRVDVGRVWQATRTASPLWMAVALVLYLLMCVVSAWRWRLLLAAQGIAASLRTLVVSWLVATFFNNFLPSNIGGDVVRVGDTARAAGSRTLAATVVLLDRGIGLLGLVFVAATAVLLAPTGVGASAPGGTWIEWAAVAAAIAALAPLVLLPRLSRHLLRPLERVRSGWVRERAGRVTTALGRFRERPGTLLTCFAGGLLVHVTLVAFYAAVARGLSIPVTVPQLAVLVPLSFVVQMLPVSVNGFGVREATFTVYFSRIGLPADLAFALSFIGAVLIMLFSLSGAAAYVLRGSNGSATPDAAA